VLERALSLARESMFTLALQRRRLQGAEPEDETNSLRWWADLQFFIQTLRRLRRCAELVSRLPDHSAMRTGIGEFDAALPSLLTMRNVGEHIDDYALDSDNRRHPVSSRQLQVGQWDGVNFSWLDETLNVDDAMEAADRLYALLRAQNTPTT
jgi:hypothetical protein